MPYGPLSSLVAPPPYLFKSISSIRRLGFRVTDLFLYLASSGVLEQTRQFIPFITG